MSEPTEPISIGVMCKGTSFRKYKADILSDLLARDDTEIDVLILHGGRENPDEQTGRVIDPESLPGPDIITYVFRFLLEANDNRRQMGPRLALNKATWRLYEDYVAQSPEVHQNFVDLGDELAGIERIECPVDQEGFSEYFRDEDVTAIESMDLDVILRFTFGIIRGDILDAARYGVWSFHHDDERKYRGGPAGFWEIYENDPVTGAILQRLTDELDAGIILERGFFETKTDSWAANYDHVVRGSTHWPDQVVTDIVEGQAEYVDGVPSTTDAKIYHAPGPDHILRLYLRQVLDKDLSLVGARNKWNVGVTTDGLDEIVDAATVPDLEWCQYPATNGFSADPFVHSFDGDRYIFFEDFDYETRQAQISVTNYQTGFRTGEIQTALDPPFHVSYPYVFSADETVYATPETAAANEIRLYRLDSPTDWELVETLVEGVPAIDPTVTEYEGRWWLFYGIEDEYANTFLYVRYADSLTGEWTPHPKNPVKTDVRSARPAGRPWESDGNLVRPGQCCVPEYGAGLVLNEVSTLTTTDFAEHQLAKLAPGPDSEYTGVHHIDSDGSLTVIDAKKPVRTKASVRETVTDLLGV